MSRAQRIQQIVNYVWEHGNISVNSAMKITGSSAATIRRDLNAIASDYADIKRVHGGLSVNSDEVEPEIMFHTKMNVNVEAKKEIAHKAAALLEPNDCVFIDSGSTCYEFARQIPQHLNLKVITTDVKIANLLGSNSNIELYIVGGMVRSNYFSIGENLAVDFIENFSADKLFMSCDGLSVKYGLTNASIFEVSIKRAILQRSAQVILLADNSKFEKVSPHFVADLSAINTLITDSRLSCELKKLYLNSGIKFS